MQTSSNNNPKPISRPSGRVLVMLAVFMTITVQTGLIWQFGTESAWQLWGFKPYKIPFADANVVTSGAESAAAGFDPLNHNVKNAFGLPMNYPRIWQVLGPLGLTQEHTIPLAISFYVAFVAGLLLFTKGTDRRAAYYTIPVVCSPVVALAWERANNDLLIFGMLGIVFSLISFSSNLALVILFASAVLKLYPIFAAAYLFRLPSREFAMRCGILFLMFLIYIAATWSDIRDIGIRTPHGKALAYGRNVLVSRLSIELNRPDLEGFGKILVLSLIVASWGVAWRCAIRLPAPEAASQCEMDAFRMGAGIYVGTFLLGYNFDYRWIFVIPVVSQLTRWHHSPLSDIRRLSRVCYVSILVSCWIMVANRWLGRTAVFLLDELSNWATFVSMTYLLVRSLPRWAWNVLAFRSLAHAGE